MAAPRAISLTPGLPRRYPSRRSATGTPSGDGLIGTDELRAQGTAVSSTIVDTVRSNVVLSADGGDLQIAGAGHDGRVEVESSPGAGATFRVWLPFAGPDPQETLSAD